MTNFDQITKSPKELAEFVMSSNIEFITETCSWCKDSDCSECDWSCYRCLLKWLKKEEKENKNE